MSRASSIQPTASSGPAAAARPRPAAPVPPKDWPPASARFTRPLQLFDTIAIYPEEAYTRPVVVRRFGRRPAVLVSDPAGIRHVLHANIANYEKTRKQKRLLEPVVGQSIFVTDGRQWQHHRQIVAPAFRHASIVGLVPMFVEAAAGLADAWDRRDSTAPIDMFAAMRDLTLRVIARALVPGDLEDLICAVPPVLERYFRSSHLIDGLVSVGLPNRAGLLLGRMAARGMDRPIRKLAREMLRRAAGPAGEAGLLAEIMEQSHRETGSRMSMEDLRNNVVSLLIAGHMTSTSTLTWAWYLIDLHPGVREALHAELERVLGGRPAAAADVPNLVYTRMVVEETMRLYPAVPAIGRENIEADEICGVAVPPGSRVTISPWVVHRHRALWADPDFFDPERLSPERRGALDRYALIPFSAGPRVCLGASFATTEMVVAIATLAQRFIPRLVPGRAVEAYSAGHVRPRGAVEMRLERRR